MAHDSSGSRSTHTYIHTYIHIYIHRPHTYRPDHQTTPDQTRLHHITPEIGLRQDQTTPEHTRPNHTRPHQTTPHQTRPHHTTPAHTTPDHPIFLMSAQLFSPSVVWPPTCYDSSCCNFPRRRHAITFATSPSCFSNISRTIATGPCRFSYVMTVLWHTVGCFCRVGVGMLCHAATC
jgi:hypothetical protein